MPMPTSYANASINLLPGAMFQTVPHIISENTAYHIRATLSDNILHQTSTMLAGTLAC